MNVSIITLLKSHRRSLGVPSESMSKEGAFVACKHIPKKLRNHVIVWVISGCSYYFLDVPMDCWRQFGREKHCFESICIVRLSSVALLAMLERRLRSSEWIFHTTLQLTLAFLKISLIWPLVSSIGPRRFPVRRAIYQVGPCY